MRRSPQNLVVKRAATTAGRESIFPAAQRALLCPAVAQTAARCYLCELLGQQPQMQRTVGYSCSLTRKMATVGLQFFANFLQ